MTGMDVEELLARHPRVFHTLSAGACPPVQRHGLLSTRRLVDLLELDSADPDRLLGSPSGRWHSVTGDAVAGNATVVPDVFS
jgi:hypothetical protein